MLHIRRYEPPDQEAVWNLHELALWPVGAHAGHGPWDDDLRDIPGVYLHRGGEFLVGTIQARIVAMGALKRTSAERAELKRMRVSPDMQGRGLGKAMLAALEWRALELGYRTLHLDTTTQQAAARQLYGMSGYREVGRSEWRGMDVISYEKDLAPASDALERR